MHVDELRAVVGVDPRIGKGKTVRRGRSAAGTQIAALFGTERLIVQPVAMSVIVRVKQNSPKEFPPSCPTRSISTKPGTRLVPLRPGPDRDLGLEQAPGLGVAGPRNSARTSPFKPPVDRRRAHLQSTPPRRR